MLLDVFLEKFQSLHGNLVASGFHATPDGGRLGNDLDIRGEGFDHHISLVADALERRNDRLPVNVIISGVPRSLPQA